MKSKITPSTGNVFRVLGFRREEAEHLLVRADLMIQLQKLIASRRLKQRSAAKILGVTQLRVSDLLRGADRLVQHGRAHRRAVIHQSHDESCDRCVCFGLQYFTSFPPFSSSSLHVASQ